MSTMFDVYQNYAELYDELVNHEDHECNLSAFLQNNIELKSKSVCEFGVGTGRVTKIYINDVKNADLFDNSTHMIEQAKNNLLQWSSKIRFFEADNRDINTIIEQYDVFIEGWSFGHLVVEEKYKSDYWIDKLINDSVRITKEKIVFIETMGTNVEKPNAPGESLRHFYSRLRQYGFNESVIQTNYLFDNYIEDARIMGGFFGDKMRNEIENSKSKEIQEYTGIWILDKKKT